MGRKLQRQQRGAEDRYSPQIVCVGGRHLQGIRDVRKAAMAPSGAGEVRGTLGIGLSGLQVSLGEAAYEQGICGTGQCHLQPI